MKELLEKLPTVKPVASTVSWSDELQQVGELCQNTAEESEGNTEESSQQHSSQEESSQSDTDTSTATVQEMSSLGNTNSSKVFVTQANTKPTSVNGSGFEVGIELTNLVNSMNRSWCIVLLKLCRFEMLLMTTLMPVVQESENSSYRTISAYK